MDDSDRPPQVGSSDAPGHSDKNPTAPEPVPAVRFASKIEEYGDDGRPKLQPTTPSRPTIPTSIVTQDQLKALTKSLASSNLQEQRLKNFSYQPFSLPASRVPSHDTSQNSTPQSQTPSGRHSPRMSTGPDVVSPPLTPSGTRGADSLSPRSAKPEGSAQSDGGYDSTAITPQASGQESTPASPRISLPHRPASEDRAPSRLSPTEDNEAMHAHRKGMFSIGPGDSSAPASRESSPSRKSASQYYSRPFTPAGDANSPYAANKRTPQGRGSANIDSRFVFSRKKGRGSPGSSTTSLVKGLDKQDKRHSSFLGVLNKSTHDLHQTGTGSTTHSRNTSMSDLKRFFKVGVSHKVKKSMSPLSDQKHPLATSTKSSYQVPFADDHTLSSKYGKIGRVLGSGAGGSVKLMKRAEDNTVFAVKEFRPRHSYETEKEYVKKLTAEFCIGSALHHGNIIETLDIVSEKGKWYEVMEYAPYDLFAIVMTGKMTKPEVTCCFLQILNGVTYLHSMGLAHRDLKLDNVVVSEHGIMKIIDFGSAHVFKYPFESGTVLASGVVGSDPYLAPEVYDERKYDPQAVDIWSLAIIFCCMSLRRFPWKVPRITDNSYKLFASEPTPGHDPKKLILPSRSTNDLTSIPQRDIFQEHEQKNKGESTNRHSDGHANGHDKGHEKGHDKGHDKSEKSNATTGTASQSGTSGGQGTNTQQKEVIRGPWRLLRLLPRESRHIIGRMLTINPRQRATMKEILEEPWVSDTVICRQEAPGQVVPALDHTHILEPPAAQPK